jgi:hypothetical protein
MVRTVPKRRVSCTALVLVKASHVRRLLASTQWGVGYIQFYQGREQSFHWRPAIKLLDSVLPLQVVYVACDDVLARGFRTYQRQDLSMRNTSDGQSSNAFFYVVGHLAVRRMRNLTSQRRAIVFSAFHTQRPTPDSITTALQKKRATGQNRTRRALACFLC